MSSVFRHRSFGDSTSRDPRRFPPATLPAAKPHTSRSTFYVTTQSRPLGPGTFDSERLKMERAFFPRQPSLAVNCRPRSEERRVGKSVGRGGGGGMEDR